MVPGRSGILLGGPAVAFGADFLDGWLVAPGEEHPAPDGVTVAARPLLMRDPDSAARLAGDALALALQLRGARG